jgi:S-adenosyl methyltransferase
MSSVDGPRAPQRIDTQTAHPARRYNYWLGGKDHFAADRASGDAVAARFPTVRIAALENRAFMRRAVTFVSREAGVRQFLDIGTGIPAPGNTHEVAQAIAPESRVVYVDNDPIVLSHARALLNSSPEGATAYLEADLQDHERILSDPYVRKTLDFSQPIALLLVAILHFVPPEDEPYRVVARLANALPAGSYLILSHATADFAPTGRPAVRPPIGGFVTRSKDEIAPFFDGMEIVSPGIVAAVDWRADSESEPRPTPREVAIYGAVGRIS